MSTQNHQHPRPTVGRLSTGFAYVSTNGRPFDEHGKNVIELTTSVNGFCFNIASLFERKREPNSSLFLSLLTSICNALRFMNTERERESLSWLAQILFLPRLAEEDKLNPA